jgi:hypothetical protein
MFNEFLETLMRFGLIALLSFASLTALADRANLLHMQYNCTLTSLAPQGDAQISLSTKVVWAKAAKDAVLSGLQEFKNDKANASTQKVVGGVPGTFDVHCYSLYEDQKK